MAGPLESGEAVRAMSQVILLSLTASLNPTLVGATTVMLLLPRPTRLMLGYLLGALMTSITLGLVIVFSLSDSSASSTTQHTVSPAVDIALGGILVVVAWVLWSGRGDEISERRRERKASKPDKGPPRWQRELSKGSARTTFIVGALLTLPGGSYLAGLDRIHKLHYSTAVTVLVVIGFNLVMLWLLEVPLLCFAVAPDWTPGAVERAKAWIGRHARTVAIRGCGGIGTLLIIKGIVGLIV
jgi:Sap, sulfolipid-1-addressing protein